LRARRCPAAARRRGRPTAGRTPGRRLVAGRPMGPDGPMKVYGLIFCRPDYVGQCKFRLAFAVSRAPGTLLKAPPLSPPSALAPDVEAADMALAGL